ncbi:MAG TPA: RDD family protein [Terriglobales bacterium]|jgi:uncharacterized RDD family membrane protein YckC
MAVETPIAVIPPDGYLSLAGNALAGIWQRFFAFLIDSIPVSIACFSVAEVLRSYFVRSPVVADLVGLAIAVTYFGIFGSKIVDGQTLGMMALSIRVVDRSGSTISVLRSINRYLVLFVPLLGGNLLPSGTPYAIYEVYGGVLEAAAVLVFYLAIFNRRTGQTLHDLATGTFVVDSPGAGPVETAPIWKPHFAIVAGSLLISLATSLIVGRHSRNFAEVNTIEDSVSRIRAGPLNVRLTFSGNYSEIIVAADCNSISSDHDRAAARIVAAVLERGPQAASHDYLEINCVNEVHVGFFRSANTEMIVHTPEEWKNLIK